MTEIFVLKICLLLYSEIYGTCLMWMKILHVEMSAGSRCYGLSSLKFLCVSWPQGREHSGLEVPRAWLTVEPKCTNLDQGGWLRHQQAGLTAGLAWRIGYKALPSSWSSSLRWERSLLDENWCLRLWDVHLRTDDLFISIPATRQTTDCATGWRKTATAAFKGPYYTVLLQYF